MSYIKVNGITVYYEINGNGLPLVLLPGLLGTIESDWRRFIPSLAQYYRTIAVDLRGHGRTDNPASSGKPGPGELDILLMADDLIGLLDRLGFESAPVLGYSLGGCIGLIAGLKQPGRIQALVMHATKFFWNAASISALTANLNPEIILDKTPHYAQTLQLNHAHVYGDSYWRELLGIAARFVRTMPETVPSLEQAAAARFPILVSVGDHDQMIPLEEASRLFRAFPRGELLVLPGTRHPFQTVQLDPFVAMMLSFFERAPKPDTR